MLKRVVGVRLAIATFLLLFIANDVHSVSAEERADKDAPGQVHTNKASRPLVIFKMARTGSSELAHLLRQTGGYRSGDSLDGGRHIISELASNKESHMNRAWLARREKLLNESSVSVRQECDVRPPPAGGGRTNLNLGSMRTNSTGRECTAFVERAVHVLACGGGFTLDPTRLFGRSAGKRKKTNAGLTQTCFERFLDTVASELPGPPVLATLIRENAVAQAASHMLSLSLAGVCSHNYHSEHCPQLLTSKISPTPEAFFGEVGRIVMHRETLRKAGRWAQRQWAQAFDTGGSTHGGARPAPGGRQAAAAPADVIEMSYEQLCHSGANGSFGIPPVLLQAVFGTPTAVNPHAARSQLHPPAPTSAQPPQGRLRSKLANYDELMQWARSHAPEHVKDLAR